MKRILPLLIILVLFGCAATQTSANSKDKDYRATISTTLGDIEVRLYNATPQHRDNFVRLAREGVFDGLLFHRVIPDFMIQAGDPKSRNAKAGEFLGDGDLGYKVPAEIVDTIRHSKGVLAAAREGDGVNPKRESSASQFYITVAPTHFLDGAYTVFGEVVSGQDVADSISCVSRDQNDRPKKDVRIKKIKIYESKN